MSKMIYKENEIYALYFVKYRFRSYLNFFSFDLDELKNQINKNPVDSNVEIFEVHFWLKKPIFKKLTVAELKKLNLR